VGQVPTCLAAIAKRSALFPQTSYIEPVFFIPPGDRRPVMAFRFVNRVGQVPNQVPNLPRFVL